MPHGSNCSPVLAVAIVALAGPWSAGGCQPAKKQASSGSGGSSANATGGKVSGGGAGGSSAIGSGGNLAGGSGGNGPGGGNGTGRGGAGGNGSGGGAGAGATGGSGGNGSGGSAGAGGSGAGGSASGGRAGASGSGSGGKGGAGSISAGGIGGMRNGGAGGTAGGSGGQTATDPGSAPTAITGLKIDANPNNVLSAFASWTTDTPADSVVQFGEGEYEWEISDPALVTSHKVLIIGMHASKAYQIKAISSAGGASVNATGNFTAGSLPAQIPVGNVAINDTTKAQAGWTLMNVQKGDGNSIPSSNYPAMAVMYDSGGQPVWYYIDGTTNDYGGAISVDLTDKGVLIGPVMNASMATGEPPREVDFAGNTLWQCADPNCGSPDGYLSHHASKLSNGDYIILRWISSGNNQNPVYEEITPDNKKVWSLDYSQFVPMPSGTSGDWCHGNAITVDIAKNVVYANCRWMGLLKTTYTNPALLWHLPASYNGKGTGTMTFSPASSQFSDTHDPEIHDDGTILFFDNGGYDSFGFPGGPTTTHHSRAVEYKIDETAKTATLVWEFPGTFTVDSWYANNWYQPFWGDADRLANGNVLITAGNRGSGTESRVFEVTKQDGKVVWELHLGPDIGVYRAGRITPPLVKAISH